MGVFYYVPCQKQSHLTYGIQMLMLPQSMMGGGGYFLYPTHEVGRGILSPLVRTCVHILISDNILEIVSWIVFILQTYIP